MKTKPKIVRRKKPRGFGKPDPRKGRRQRNTQSKYCGNNEACDTCGVTYGDFKTGFTYYDIWLMFWTPKDVDNDEWKYKTRGVILGKWFEIKQDMWEQHKRECDMQASYDKGDEPDLIDLEDIDLSDVPF